MYKLVALTVLLALSGTEAFFRCCTNQPNTVCPSAIVSESCSGDRCTVKGGDRLLANATFTPVRPHQKLDVTVTARVGLLTFPLDPPTPDACEALYRNDVKVSCPTIPNIPHVWNIDFLVPSTVPTVNSATIRYLLSENGINEGCVDILATVK